MTFLTAAKLLSSVKIEPHDEELTDRLYEIVLGETMLPNERVEALLEIFGRGRIQEPHWSSVVAALLATFSENVSMILHALVERMNDQRFSAVSTMYPAAITGVLTVCNRSCVQVPHHVAEEVGRMFRHYAESSYNPRINPSQPVIHELSDQLREFLTAENLSDETKQTRARQLLEGMQGQIGKGAALTLFTELAHRIFGMLSPHAKLKALETCLD